MKLLKGLGLLGELLFEPLDGRGLVGDEDLKLQDLPDRHALLVVLSHLFREEVHPVPLREPLQPLIKLRRRQRHSHAALDVEGHHAVEQQIVLPLGDNLGLAILGHKDREFL